MKTIVIANQKGGVGKTGLSAIIALLIKLLGVEISVRAIDLDPQGHLTYLYGHDPDALGLTIYDVLLGRCTLGEVTLETRFDPDSKKFFDPKAPLTAGTTSPTYGDVITGVRGPDLVPINITASNAEGELRANPMWGSLLRHVLVTSQSYDYTVVDTNPALGVLTLNAIYAADYVLIPVQPETLSVRGLKDLYTSILQAQRTNTTLQIAGAVASKVQNYRTHRNKVAELRETLSTFGIPMFSSIIKQNASFIDAVDNGSLVTIASPRSEQAKTYNYVLAELLDIVGGPGRAQPQVEQALTELRHRENAVLEAE